VIKWTGETGIENCRYKNLIDFYNAIKSNAVYPVHIHAEPRSVNVTDNKFGAICFYDSRVSPPFLVGTIDYDSENYIVVSGLIKNEKFARYNHDFHSKRSKDFKKALKVALTYIRPASWELVAQSSRRDISVHLAEWSNKPAQAINNHIRYRISREDVYGEITHAIEMNARFKTDVFNDAIKVILENREEAKRREALNLTHLFVFINAQGMYESNVWTGTKSDDELPEEVRMKLGMLRLLDEPKTNSSGTILDEVGTRCGNYFWVFIEEPTRKLLTADTSADKV
jgi:hypothetical protein